SSDEDNSYPIPVEMELETAEPEQTYRKRFVVSAAASTLVGTTVKLEFGVLGEPTCGRPSNRQIPSSNQLGERRYHLDCFDDIVSTKEIMQESKTHDLPDRTLGSGTLPSPEAGVKDRDVSSALRKLDLFLLPAVTLIYFLNFLDRSNIGNAKTAGLQTDLKLSNRQYSTALTITYVPYIAAELPLTLAIQKIGANKLLPTLVCCWGIAATFQGFIHNYSGLLAARFFLGLAEGAILPVSISLHSHRLVLTNYPDAKGCITYLSIFYRRADLGKRVAFFFSATSLAGAFSGLLAAAILDMDGLSGKHGWQWIFILEGILTVLCGLLFFLILPKDVNSTRYLNQQEKEALVSILELDAGARESEENLSVNAVRSAFRSVQVWLVFVQLFANGALKVMLYALAYFAPSKMILIRPDTSHILTKNLAIVQGLGYKGTASQLYTVPPYVCSAFFSILTCWASDRSRTRGLFVMGAGLIAVIGYAMYLASKKHSVLYASLFLQVIGTYTVAPLLSTWMPNNLAGYHKRVTGITLGFISSNSGGILST
ncbi:MAG: hypothetical protein TREMPRED_005279, partial [Tremellales sp. Tagirdzhanova-0007]